MIDDLLLQIAKWYEYFSDKLWTFLINLSCNNVSQDQSNCITYQVSRSNASVA